MIQNKVTLAFVKPLLNLSKDIAIVGSSGSLTNSGLGKKIDSFNEIVRFNRAPTKGYESSVGSKTTLRVSNNHVFDNLDILNDGYSNSPPNFVRDMRNQKILYVGSDIKPWNRRHVNTHMSNSLHLFNYDKLAIIKDYIGATFKENMLVGTIVITLCVMAKTRPTLFGFDLQPVPRTHYWQDRPKEWNSVHHNPSEEQKILLKLHSNGHINIA
jgi:hypothetical protein